MAMPTRFRRVRSRGALRRVLIILFALVPVHACGGDGDTSPTDSDDGPGPVASVTVSPDTAIFVEEGETVEFAAVAEDAEGARVTDASFTWSSSDTSVVSVDEGTATARANGGARVSAAASGSSDEARVAVRAGELRWTDIHVGLIHSCGLTTHGTAFCWGDNVHGQVGDGTTAGEQQSPSQVHGGTRFLASLGVGGGNTCALTFEGAAFCWGNSTFGEGGYGENTGTRTEPTAVSGGHRFRVLGVGGSHACAVTADGDGYCWGANRDGRLGDGTRTDRSTPVRVQLEQPLAVIRTGRTRPTADHTCGLDTQGRAYCWGPNADGKLGDGSTEERDVPTRVEGDLRFEDITVGGGHTCGLAADGAAYCWGANDGGQLGDGSRNGSAEPVEVQGDLEFRWLSAGSDHTCGVTAEGRAYCWGWNGHGQLGDGGGDEWRPFPVEVSGGRSWSRVEAGASYSCGVTDSGTGYCWGANEVSQLGGPFGNRAEPEQLPDPGEIG